MNINLERNKTNGAYKNTDGPKVKEDKLIRAMVAHIMINKLQINAEDWKQITFTEIYKNKEGGIILNFDQANNVGFIYSKVSNLGRNSTISINEYVPKEFRNRHTEITALAKQIRMRGNTKTHVRMETMTTSYMKNPHMKSHLGHNYRQTYCHNH